jgi:WD40 repeat protein
LFKKCAGKHVPNVPDPDFVKWADDPLVAGWDVQGLYQDGFDGTDLNDATVTSDNKLIVTGDDFGIVRIHNYPAIDPSACFEYTGHAEFVVGVEMLRSDKQLISCGGADMAIFQWEIIKDY